MSDEGWNKLAEDRLTEDAVVKEIKSAFSPLRCEVKWKVDYGDRLRWEVFDTDGRPFSPMVLTKDQARSLSQLRAILSGYRQGLEQKGYELDPWPKTV